MPFYCTECGYVVNMSGKQQGKNKPDKNAKSPSSPGLNTSASASAIKHTASIGDAMDEPGKVATLFDCHDRLRSDHERLSKEHTVLQCRYETLQGNHDRLSSDHTQLFSRVDNLESRIFELEKMLDKVQKDRDCYASANDILKQKVETLENIAEDAETSQRSAYLVVSNLPEQTSKSDEEIFIELCNNHLELPENITKNDIANVSRIKGNNNNNNTSNNNAGRSNKPKLMVIKFQNEKARNIVFSNKKKLKGTSKVISEFLTRKKSDLLKKCYDKIPGSFTERSIWTHFGKILVRKAGSDTKTFEIKSDIDIDKFLHAHGMSARMSP